MQDYMYLVILEESFGIRGASVVCHTEDRAFKLAWREGDKVFMISNYGADEYRNGKWVPVEEVDT